MYSIGDNLNNNLLLSLQNQTTFKIIMNTSNSPTHFLPSSSSCYYHRSSLTHSLSLSSHQPCLLPLPHSLSPTPISRASLPPRASPLSLPLSPSAHQQPLPLISPSPTPTSAAPPSNHPPS